MSYSGLHRPTILGRIGGFASSVFSGPLDRLSTAELASLRALLASAMHAPPTG